MSDNILLQKKKVFIFQLRLLMLGLMGVWLLLPLESKAQKKELQRFEYAEMHMGVKVRLVAYAPGQTVAEQAARAAFDEVAALNNVMSNYVPSSELMRLCTRAGGPPVQVSKELFFILQRALTLSFLSGGAFDITVGPYADLWRDARRKQQLPDEQALAKAGARVGWQKVALDPVRRTVKLKVPGMQIDLGGIAKGYALDRALAVLKAHGVERALVDAGGDVAVSGPPPGEKGWKVTVKHASPANRALTLSHAAVASSGDTQQFVEFNGTRYSHIVDPRTGKGLTSRIAVTVVAPDGLTADSYATAISVMGASKGQQFAQAVAGVRAFIKEVQ